MKVAYLAVIQTGTTLPQGKPLSASAIGNVSILQPADLNRDNTAIIRTPRLEYIPNIPAHQILQPGDIILAAKGNRNGACLYNGEHFPLVAPNYFFLLRPHLHLIHPAYLAGVLNSDQTQTYFAKNRVGSSTLSLPKRVIEDYTIQLPSLADQERIAGLYTTTLAAAEVCMNLAAQYRILASHYINRTIA